MVSDFCNSSLPFSVSREGPLVNFIVELTTTPPEIHRLCPKRVILTLRGDRWTVTGTAAVVVLGVVCAMAWWHQRRLRKLFWEEAESLETDWITTTTAVTSSRGVETSVVAATVVQQPNSSPSELTAPKKELG